MFIPPRLLYFSGTGGLTVPTNQHELENSLVLVLEKR